MGVNGVALTSPPTVCPRGHRDRKRQRRIQTQARACLLVTSTPHAFSSPEAPSPPPGSAAQGPLRDPRTTAPRDRVPTLQDPPSPEDGLVPSSSHGLTEGLGDQEAPWSSRLRSVLPALGGQGWRRSGRGPAKPQEAQPRPPAVRSGVTTPSQNSAGPSPQPMGPGPASANRLTAPGLCVAEARLSLLRTVWEEMRNTLRDLPGGPAVKTSRSQCRGPRFDHWSGN